MTPHAPTAAISLKVPAVQVTSELKPMTLQNFKKPIPANVNFF